MPLLFLARKNEKQKKNKREQKKNISVDIV